MKKRTRRLILNIATAVAITATGALVLLPRTASAADARTNGPITVFDGPGIDYQPLGNIGPEQNVTVEQCQAGYCYIDFGPLAGWVQQGSLDMQVGGPDVGPGPGVSVGIDVAPLPPPPGPDFGPGPDYGPAPGPGPGPGPFPHRPRGPGFATAGDVCFFDSFNYRGASFCMNAGDSTPFLGDWANSIRSIDNPDGYDVRVCTNPGFRGCRVYTSSARSLGRYDRSISSVSIR